jgi:hypothetical protein
MLFDTMRALLHHRRPDNVVVSRLYRHPKRDIYSECHASPDHICEWQRLDSVRDREEKFLDCDIRVSDGP